MIGDVLVRIGADISDYERNIKQASGQLESFGSSVSSAGQSIATTFGAIAAASTVGIGYAVKQAMDYQSAFAGVRKTTEATEAEYASLSRQIQDMAKEIPASAEEIASVAEIAGQLGIAKDDLIDFTRTMVDLGVTTNMSAEEAATSLARLANITGMSMSDIDRLGATVVGLGNSLATTESEIVEMGLRLAGAGSQIGLTEAQILSFAGALSSVGIQAESGGTAFSRVFLDMNTAVMNGGDKLEKFAKIAGMSAGDFATAFEKDASNALITFITGLGKMSDEGANTAEVLDDLGLGEIRVRDALMRASGASEVFTDALQLGNKAWDENSALTNEAAERYATFASKLKVFGNRIQGIVRNIGGPFMETLSGMIDAIDPVITAFEKLAEWFANSSDNTKLFITTAALMIPVLASLAAGFGLLLLAIGGIASSVGALIGVFGSLGGAALGVVGIVAALGAVIPAIVGFAVVVAKNWDEVGAKTTEMVGKVKAAFSDIPGTLRSVADSTSEFLRNILPEPVVAFIESAADTISQAFGKISDTLKSAFSGDSESIGKVFANIIPTAIGFIIGGLPGLVVAGAKFLPAISDGIEKYSGAIGDTLSDVLNTGLKAISKYLPKIAESGVEIIERLLEGIVTAIPTITESITDILLTIIEVITENLPMILEAGVTILTEIINGIVASLPLIIEVITTLISTITVAIAVLLPLIIEAGISLLLAIIEGIVEALPQLIETALTLINTIIDTVIELLPIILEAGIEILMAIIEGIVEALPQLIEAISEMITTLIDKIIELLPQIIEAGIEVLLALIDGIVEALPDLIDAALTVILALADAIIDNLPEIIDAGIKVLTALIDGIIDALPELLEAGVKLVTDLAAALVEMGPELFDAGIELIGELIGGLLDMLGELGDAAVEIGKELVSGIGDFSGDMFDIGVDLLTGLWDGIDSMTNTVMNKAKEIGQGVVGWFKRTFDINSPSRVMRNEIGRRLGEGLIIGMNDEISAIQKMAQRVSEAATPEPPKLAGFEVGDMRGHAKQMSATLRAEMSDNSAVAVGTDNAILSDIRDELRKQKQMIVELDRREVGRAIEPEVSKIQGQNVKEAKAIRGQR